MRPLAWLPFIALAAVTCDSPSSVGGPGKLLATLRSPHGPEGAAVMDLAGSAIDASAVEGGIAFTRVSDGVLRVVLVLDRPGTITFAVDVADVNSLPAVTVLEVADGTDGLRASLDRYKVDFERIQGPTLGAAGSR